MSPRPSKLAIAVLAASACSSGPTPEPRAPGALDRAASWRDLVAQLDRSDVTDPGCLLRHDGAGWHMAEAAWAGARPLPSLASDLDAMLVANAGPVAIESELGCRAASNAPLAIRALTHTPWRFAGFVLVVYLTDRGAYARLANTTVEHTAPMSDRELLESITRSAVGADASALLVAEPDVPAARVIRDVEALDRLGVAVGFAVARTSPCTPVVDDEWQVAADDTKALGLCAGERVGASVLEVDAPAELRDAVRSCVAAAATITLPHPKLALRMHVGIGGAIEAACAELDTMHSTPMRRCVLAAATRLQLPAFAGLDLRIDLAVAPDDTARRTLCR